MSSMSDDVAATLDVSRETIERLQIYVDVLQRWQTKINLVASSTIPHIWDRHILDSGQLKLLVPGWEKASWIDLGSGGGFPGMVMGILRPSEAPPIRLVESNRKKTLFLRDVSRETNANVEILNCRIEELDGQQADIVSARACADLTKLLSWAEPLLSSGGHCVFHKGQYVDDELTEAHKYWRMKVTKRASLTHQHGNLLLIGEIERV